MTEILQTPKLVTVFGGSGFVGRHVVRALAKRGYRIRVAAAGPISPAICSRSAMSARSSRCRPMCACAGRSTAPCRAPTMSSISSPSCIETGRQKFDAVHEFGARAVAEAARARSAPASPISRRSAPIRDRRSIYARTKARGEKAVLETVEGRRDLPAVDHVRSRGRLLQPLRRHGALFAGAAADRRRPDQIPAGLCRRCRRGDRAFGRRQGQGRHRSTSSAGRRC